MKSKINYNVILFVLLLFAPSYPLSEEYDLQNDNSTFPSSIVVIEIVLDGVVGQANGVYLNVKNELYLVTAGHVLFDSDSNVRVSYKTILSSVSSNKSDSSLHMFSLNLVESSAHGDVRYWEDIDLAVVRMTQSSNKPSDYVQIIQRANYPLTSFSVKDSRNCDSIYWLCWVNLVGYTDVTGSNLSRNDLEILSGQILAVRRHSPTFVMSFRSKNGYSGAPIFIECEEDGDGKTYFCGIHTSTFEWDEEGDSLHTGMVSIGTCADVIFDRIEESW